MAYLPDGKTLITAGAQTDVHLWDLATGKQVRRLGGHEGLVTALALSPDGATLAAFSPGVLHWWDIATGTELRQTKLPAIECLSMAFSPDGKSLALAATDKSVRFLAVATGQETGRLAGAIERRGLAYSPDGKFLALAASGASFRLWDVAGGKEHLRLQGRRGPGLSVSFSPDGKTLATAGMDGIQLWAVDTGQEVWRFPGGLLPVDVTFSRDGAMVAARLFSGKICLLEAATGRERTVSRRLPEGDDQALFLPDGTTLASWGSSRDCNDGKPVHFWEARTGRELPHLALPDSAPTWRRIEKAALAADGATLAVNDYDGVVWLLDRKTGALKWTCPGRHCDILLTPDGCTLLTVKKTDRGERFVMQFWQVATGKETHKFIGPPGLELPIPVAISSDGKTIATRSLLDRVIRVWDVASSRQLRQIPTPRKSTAFAFSPNGRTLATTGGLPQEPGVWDPIPDEVKLWDLAGDKEPLAFARHERTIAAVQFSPDGRTVATGGEAGQIRLWETATGKERQALLGHSSWINTLSFSPDGKQLVSAATDRTALVWGLAGYLTDEVNVPAISPRELESHWAALADENAAEAYLAMRVLAAYSHKTVPFLRKHLQTVPAPDGKRVRELIADLDRDEFAIRENAARQLEKLGDVAEPALRQALQGKPSPEKERQLSQLLQKLQGWPPERLREWRALEVLECVGTVEAKQLLEALAKGAPAARLTQEAKASLERLAKRARTTP